MCAKLSQLSKRKRSQRKTLPLLIVAVTFTLLLVYYFFKVDSSLFVQNLPNISTKNELEDLNLDQVPNTADDSIHDYDNAISLESPEYQLIRKHCKIPRAPLLVKKVMKEFNQKEIEAEKCTNEDDVTELDTASGKITFNESKYESCCYKIISRPYKMISDSYKLDKCKPILNNDTISNEYFLTVCTYRNKTKRHRIHSNIPIHKPGIVEKVKYWNGSTTENNRPPSVFMLALDSTSRIHGYRSLPKTMELLKKMKFIDFKGHHAFGEPTQANAIPLLLGESSAKDFYQNKKRSWQSKWDEFPFIWKLFNRLKYITYYSEDKQEYGTFQYGGQTGFTFQPCDIYLRPLYLAQEKEASHYSSTRSHCVANDTITEFSLKHHLEFLQKFKTVPSFSINWLCWPQHDAFKIMPILDDFIFDYFTKLSKEPQILANTVIIVFGDHGVWREPYAETKIGILERKLPLLLIRYPENLSRKYPDHLENLKKNAYTITSHHDVYQTLIHLSQIPTVSDVGKFSSNTPEEFRYSLLQNIPESRTCSDAQIPEPFCSCNNSMILDTDVDAV